METKLNVTKGVSMFEIPFELTKNVAYDGWKPDESMIDPEFFSREDYEAALSEYEHNNENVIFKNTFLEWDSCDCGDGYGCSHGSWVYAIRVNQHGKKAVEISVEDGDQLLVENNLEGEEYGYISMPVEGITIGDFARACELMGIELELTEYGKSLITPSQLLEQNRDLTEALENSNKIIKSSILLIEAWQKKTEFLDFIHTCKAIELANDRLLTKHSKDE